MAISVALRFEAKHPYSRSELLSSITRPNMQQIRPTKFQQCIAELLMIQQFFRPVFQGAPFPALFLAVKWTEL